jgi:hypothetical protein
MGNMDWTCRRFVLISAGCFTACLIVSGLWRMNLFLGELGSVFKICLSTVDWVVPGTIYEVQPVFYLLPPDAVPQRMG